MTANHRRKKGRSKNRMKRRIQLYTRVGAACLILLTVVLGGMKVFHWVMDIWKLQVQI